MKLLFTGNPTDSLLIETWACISRSARPGSASFVDEIKINPYDILLRVVCGPISS